MVIAHNISAINTYKSLGISGNSANKAMEKLSSGYKINKAADDAAGLSISEKMRSQIRGLNQASHNAENGISLIQTAEGALNEVHSILQRMRELSVQSATDTNAIEDREALQGEINQLKDEIDRIGDTTQFNGIYLFKEKEVEVPKANISNSTIESKLKPVINTTINSYNLIDKPTLNLESDGTYQIDMTSGIGIGNEITIGGVKKTIAKGDSIVTISDSAKFVYDKDGNMLYEHLNGIRDVKEDIPSLEPGVFKYHIEKEDIDSFVEYINDNYSSIDEIVNSGEYYFYKVDEGSLIAPTTSQIVSSRVYNLTANNGDKVTITDTQKNNHYWSTSRVLYDDSGFKWDPNSEQDAIKYYDNLKYIYNKNYFNYGVDDGRFSIVTGAQKAKLYTQATLTKATSDMFTLKTENVISMDNTDKQIINDLKTKVDALDLKDDDGNSLKAYVSKKEFGKYEIKLTNANVQIDEDTSLSFHVGANSNQVISVTLNSMNSDTLDVKDVDITNRKNANKAIQTIDNAIKSISNERSKYGAIQNRLEYTINNLNTTAENMTASESTIRDVDMADEMMEYTKNNILQQAAQAMLVQANARPQQALQLLG